MIDTQASQTCSPTAETPLAWTSGLSVYDANGQRFGPLVDLDENQTTLDYLAPRTSIIFRLNVPSGAYQTQGETARWTGDNCTGVLYVEPGNEPVANHAFNIGDDRMFIIAGAPVSITYRSIGIAPDCLADVATDMVEPTRQITTPATHHKPAQHPLSEQTACGDGTASAHHSLGWRAGEDGCREAA